MLIPGFLSWEFAECTSEFEKRDKIENPTYEPEKQTEPAKEAGNEVTENAGYTEPAGTVQLAGEPSSILWDLWSFEFGESYDVKHPPNHGEDLENSHCRPDIMVIAECIRKFFVLISSIFPSHVGKILHRVENDTENAEDGFGDGGKPAE